MAPDLKCPHFLRDYMKFKNQSQVKVDYLLQLLLVHDMFKMSAFFTDTKVQTNFYVFENSLENIFVYDSDCFSNFCLQFINSL